MDEERGVKQELNREQFLQQRKDKLAKEAQKRLDFCVCFHIYTTKLVKFKMISLSYVFLNLYIFLL